MVLTRTSRVNGRIIRHRIFRNILLLQLVADTPDGKDALWFSGVSLYLFSEPPDVDINGARVSGVVIAPDFFQKLFPAEDQPPVTGQESEQVKFLWRQVKNPASRLA